MKIATYNVNGINGRPSVLLRWRGDALFVPEDRTALDRLMEQG